MSGGRGVRGNREVSPLRKRPYRQSRHGLFSDVAVLSVRGGGRHAGRAEAIPEEGGSWGEHRFPHESEPKASDRHAVASAPRLARIPSSSSSNESLNFCTPSRSSVSDTSS